MSVNLKVEDFREFNESDWMGFGGADAGEGTPLIYDGPLVPYIIILDKNLVGIYFEDAPDDINGMQKEVSDFKVAKRMVGAIRWPDMETDDIEDLELLGFYFN
jgi:hypothetical protein